MGGRKIATTVYLTPEQDSLLKVLHQKTQLPVAHLVRKGINMVLDHYADQIPEVLTRERKGLEFE